MSQPFRDQQLRVVQCAAPLFAFDERHFAVRPVEQAFVVEDPGSSNGTTVTGATGKLKLRELRDGDLIQAGGIDFLFVRPE